MGTNVSRFETCARNTFGESKKISGTVCTSRNFGRNEKRLRSPAGPRRLRNSDAHKRIAVPQAFCVLREHPRPRPKSGKVCRSTPLATQGFRSAQNGSRVVIPPPSETPPVSACKPLCAILLAKASVYPPQSLETNVAAFVPEVLKPHFCRVLFLVGSEVEMPASNGQQRKQGSRRSPAKRVRWEEETQRNE